MKERTSRKQVMFRILAGCCGVILAGLVATGLFYTGFLRMNYPSQHQYPVRGIDISHHQHDIEWERLPRETVDFAYIKATEGGDFKDPLFLQNWRSAEKEGLPHGAYHFFTFCSPGAVQAANFIDTVPVEPHTLPPVIDLEFGGNCRDHPSSDAIEKELQDFIAIIKQTYHRSPVLYVTYEAYEEYIKGRFKHHEIWIRDIFWTPSLSDNRSWRVWQYGNRGRMRGISTYVDLNVFSGSKEEFERWIQ